MQVSEYLQNVWMFLQQHCLKRERPHRGVTSQLNFTDVNYKVRCIFNVSFRIDGKFTHKVHSRRGDLDLEDLGQETLILLPSSSVLSSLFTAVLISDLLAKSTILGCIGC